MFLKFLLACVPYTKPAASKDEHKKGIPFTEHAKEPSTSTTGGTEKMAPFIEQPKQQSDGTTHHIRKMFPLIEEVRDRCGVASMAVGVLHLGKIVLTEGFGYRDDKERIAPDGDTMYLLVSISKTFVAAAIGILVEEGKLRWTDKIRTHIPEFDPKGNPKIAQVADIHDLLRHTSGLKNPVVPILGPTGLVIGHETDFLELVNQTPTSAEQGEGFEWEYSNVGYGLAAKVVEKVSGTSFSEFVRQRILKPLSMNRTAVSKSDVAEAENIAHPYAQDENGVFSKLHCDWTDETRTSILASFGVRSSVHDLLTWCAATMSAENNQDLEPDFKHQQKIFENPLKQMQTIRSVAVEFEEEYQDQRECGYCLGWFKATMPSTLSSWGSYNMHTTKSEDILEDKDVLGADSPPRILIRHTGLGVGAAVSLNTFPETNSAVVVLSNGLNVGDASDFAAQILIQALFDLKPYISIMPRVQLETSLRRQQFELLIREWQENRGAPGQKDGRDDGEFLGDYEGLATTLSVCNSDVGNISLVFGDRRDKPFPLEYYKKDQYSFFPHTRDQWSTGGWLDWDYYKIGVLDFTRNESGEVTGLWWTWERPSDPIWFRRRKRMNGIMHE